MGGRFLRFDAVRFRHLSRALFALEQLGCAGTSFPTGKNRIPPVHRPRPASAPSLRDTRLWLRPAHRLYRIVCRRGVDEKRNQIVRQYLYKATAVFGIKVLVGKYRFLSLEFIRINQERKLPCSDFSE